MINFSRLLITAFLLLGTVLTPLSAQRITDLTEGVRAPAFKVTSLDGQELDSDAMQDQVKVLNFWFIQCPPCRSEIPKLNELVKAYKGKPVQFIAFSPDDENSLKGFLSEVPFDYKVVANATPVAVDFAVTGAPTHVVIDSRGEITRVIFGEVAAPLSDLGSVIDPLLDEK